MDYDNINIEEMNYDDLKQRRGMIDNYYDQSGNWWLVFIFTEDTENDVHTVFNVLDFKPSNNPAEELE